LTRSGTRNHSETISIITSSKELHHLYSTTGQTKSHGPNRSLARPVHHFVDTDKNMLYAVSLIRDRTYQLRSWVPSKLQGRSCPQDGQGQQDHRKEQGNHSFVLVRGRGGGLSTPSGRRGDSGSGVPVPSSITQTTRSGCRECI